MNIEITLFSDGVVRVVRQMRSDGMRIVVYRDRKVVHTVEGDTDACDLDRLVELGHRG